MLFLAPIKQFLYSLLYQVVHVYFAFIEGDLVIKKIKLKNYLHSGYGVNAYVSKECVQHSTRPKFKPLNYFKHSIVSDTSTIIKD